MSTICIDNLRKAIDLVSQRMFTKYEELNTLDGKLGDGDIGITMKTGFQAVLEKYHEWPEDLGKALMSCAMLFVNARASSYGTLIASGLMSAASECKGKNTLKTSDIAPLLKVAQEGMAKRGKSELGQKTVLDAIHAAYKAAKDYKGHDLKVLTINIHKAVEEAVELYKKKPSLQGRARMFGNKSVGIPDAGMVVFREMAASLVENTH